jgi:hypothetical protein
VEATGDEIGFICDEELQARLKVWKMREMQYLRTVSI